MVGASMLDEVILTGRGIPSSGAVALDSSFGAAVFVARFSGMTSSLSRSILATQEFLAIQRPWASS